jgi:hypothetical protein
MRRKIRQYLPALLLYVQRRVGGERGVVVAVRTRDVCVGWIGGVGWLCTAS